MRLILFFIATGILQVFGQIIACPIGTYKADNCTCVQCPQGSFSNTTDSLSCIPCPNHTFCDTGAFFPLSCPLGTDSFIRTNPGMVVTGISTKCLPCPTGYTNFVVGTECVQCPVGTSSLYNNQGGTSCIACTLNTFSSIEGTPECTPCPVGTETLVTNSVSCQPCQTGSFSNVAGSGCSQCPIGTSAPTVASISCQQCNPGTFSANPGQSQCTPCVYGTVSEFGQAFCTPCPIGSEAVIRNESGAVIDISIKCLLCQPGTFKNIVTDPECQQCPNGTISGYGAFNCTECGPGEESIIRQENGSYIESRRICYPCSPGYYKTSEMSTCLPCSAGYFSSSFKSIECEPCGVGYFANSTGNNKCEQCSQGTFTDFTGSSICTECSPGYFSNGTTSCIPCPEGFTSESGFPKCYRTSIIQNLTNSTYGINLFLIFGFLILILIVILVSTRPMGLRRTIFKTGYQQT